MKIEYITIDAGQRFDAVMPEIPTNSIINKTVTGCGATYAEINAPRHSVIIEPNVPVIEGKMKKHPQILGVFEGVTTEDIIDFLNTNYNDGYLKIMTTPESFPKVRSAMVQTHTDMYGEWFMLFDECERTIQDAGYRGSITLPMDDFFRCKQKAMVSATPIIPSDPRFEQQGFTMKILRPTYDQAENVAHTYERYRRLGAYPYGTGKRQRASALHLSELDRYDPPHDLHL